MEIRGYRNSDEQGVMALWREVFAYTAPHNEPAFVIQHKLAVQAELFFVATTEGTVAGTVMGGYDGHRGWVYSLAVAPRFRRQGIGAALMRHVEKALRDRGCPKVNLQMFATRKGDFVELEPHVER